MPLKVIVVGAGIAGLCTAVSLRQAGHEVEIFEKSAFATEIGAALALTPNGTRVLDRLGFLFARAWACAVQAWDTADGTMLSTLATIDLSKAQQMFGATCWAIHCVDLYSELLCLATGKRPEVSGQPARLHLSSVVVEVSPDGTIVLEDRSKHVADLVVAADGLRSIFRDVVLGADAQNWPTHSGSAAFRFLVETNVLKKDPVLATLLETKEGRATILVDTTEAERERHIMWYACCGGETQNFVGIHPSQKEAIEEGEEAKSEMEEFSHFHADIHCILGLAEYVKCWPLFIHASYPTWVNGRIVLIGDAAHPMLPFGGQGSNSAIKDGATLGFLFQDIDDASQVEKRLALFEHVRKNRASRIQVLSKVRAGREKEVEEDVRQYADSPNAPVPMTLRERTIHDYSYDVFGECEKVLGARL